MDVVSLSDRWAAAWGACRPVGHELRACLHDRWVRFHSLPGSKRYPGSDDEYAEVLRRQLTVLGELPPDDAGGEHELLLVTASWSDSPQPEPRAPRLADAVPVAAHWASVLTRESDPEASGWTHLWASAVGLDSQELARLLRLVADDETAGVIITTAGMRWLYHPYDGGADVIATSTGHRDQLRQAHADWLSAHPAAL